MPMKDVLEKPLQALAQQRVKYRRIYIYFHLGCAGLAGLALLLAPDLAMWAVPSVLFLMAAFYPLASALFRYEYKRYLIDFLCEATGFSFHHAGYLDNTVLKSHRLPLHPVTWATSCKHEDGFRGRVAGAPFVIQEVLYAGEEYAKRPPNNHPRGYHPWRWIFIRIKADTPHPAHTVIAPDSLIRTALSDGRAGLKRVNIVSADFEDAYDVLSSDQVEARAYLTPDHIEAVTELAKDGSMDGVEISLKGRDVLICFHAPQPLMIVPKLALLKIGRDDAKHLEANLERFFHVVDVMEHLVTSLGLLNGGGDAARNP